MSTTVVDNASQMCHKGARQLLLPEACLGRIPNVLRYCPRAVI